MSLREPLAEPGVSALFTAPDLSGMSDEPLVVAAIEHEAVVEADEDGTRAAAATAVVVQTRATPRSIDVNRPFLFSVIDEPTSITLQLPDAARTGRADHQSVAPPRSGEPATSSVGAERRRAARQIRRTARASRLTLLV